jgi:carboxylesterase type B
MTPCVISAPCGPVRGTESSGIRIFRGIPYACAERFERPHAIPAWNEVLEADQETDCPQYGSYREETDKAGAFYRREFHSELRFHYAENPLTLNIVAPADASRCGVLVFIHGGGFETGTVGDLPYGACTEYARQGVVFVSVGYRLNVFGLYGGRNLCLYDQMEAISWVRVNIAAFGGDPDRITLIGQSAGAMCIMDLCLTDALKGRIRGAVMMSGGGLIPRFAGPRPPAYSEKFWQAVRLRAGAASEDALKALPAKTVWEAWFSVFQERRNIHDSQPEIDGAIIPNVPQRVFSQSGGLAIPIIFSVTSQDFLAPVLYGAALRAALLRSGHGLTSWGYFFDRTPPGNSYKAFHGSDLWYLFGNMEQSWRPFDKTDRRLSDQMIRCICSFVKTGSPNGHGLPVWPAVTPEQKGFRLFDGRSGSLICPAGCRFKTMKSLLLDRGPM